MAINYSNEDKMLQAVLNNAVFIEKAGFNPAEYNTIPEALASDNVYVRTVALIIDGNSQGDTKKELYNKVSSFLNQNLI